MKLVLQDLTVARGSRLVAVLDFGKLIATGETTSVLRVEHVMHRGPGVKLVLQDLTVARGSRLVAVLDFGGLIATGETTSVLRDEHVMHRGPGVTLRATSASGRLVLHGSACARVRGPFAESEACGRR